MKTALKDALTAHVCLPQLREVARMLDRRFGSLLSPKSAYRGKRLYSEVIRFHWPVVWVALFRWPVVWRTSPFCCSNSYSLELHRGKLMIKIDDGGNQCSDGVIGGGHKLVSELEREA